MAVAVAALGVAVLLAANGGLGKVVAAIGSSFDGFVTDLTQTPAPSAVDQVVADAPTLEAPAEPYTNQPTVDLVGTVPANVVGQAATVIRIYVQIGAGRPGPVTDVPIGSSQHFLVPGVTLSPGPNTFTATVVGPGGLESDASAAVAYILDTKKPVVTISAPRTGAIVNAKLVTIVGQTQARSELSVKNLTTNATVAGSADSKGAFSVAIPIANGTNSIQVTATDPAGNGNASTVTVRRGTGALTASLSANFYQVQRSSLPKSVTLSVTVTDPDGLPLRGAEITFTVAIPNISPIVSSTLTTSGTGKATFTTSISKAATKGLISVTVIVHTADFGDTTPRTVITIR